MNERKILKKAIDRWGEDAQTKMVLEEMSELQKEICKRWRGRDNRSAIAEETADVEIMLDQLKRAGITRSKRQKLTPGGKANGGDVRKLPAQRKDCGIRAIPEIRPKPADFVLRETKKAGSGGLSLS